MTNIQLSKSHGSGSPDVVGFYDEPTGSVQYLVSDPQTRKAALIDVVMGFDPKNASTNTKAADEILRHAKSENLEIEWILDTHPHADHLMASSYLKEKLGSPNAIGSKVTEIAGLWRDYYNLPHAFDPAKDFDRLFEDGDTFKIGSLDVRVVLAAGHTLGSISYLVGEDAAFVHDTFMQPDSGTARADFPGGSAETLFETLTDILSLPDETRLFIGHDYGTDDRSEQRWESTVKDQRRNNIHVGGDVSKEEFVKKRTQKDSKLALPDRMLHVLQMNLRAGRLPPSENDGHHYLKIPMNRL